MPLRGWDTEATVEARSPAALWYLLSAPSELGLARAYVTGAIEIDGDLHAALAGMESPQAAATRAARAPDRRAAVAEIRPAPVPPEEAPPRWRRGLVEHTHGRDAAAIAHHYDLSNRFYRVVLGPSMAYSCAVFTTRDTTLEAAQEEKFDLICRKLDLRPGQRLLDVGTGWGGMVVHAAAQLRGHGARVTLSRSQVHWARSAIAEPGLAERAEVRLLDYRDLAGDEFDAISSIGAMEHFGSRRAGVALLRDGPPPAARRQDAQPLHHAAVEPPAPAPRTVHRPLRVSRLRAGGAGRR